MHIVAFTIKLTGPGKRLALGLVSIKIPYRRVVLRHLHVYSKQAVVNTMLHVRHAGNRSGCEAAAVNDIPKRVYAAYDHTG